MVLVNKTWTCRTVVTAIFYVSRWRDAWVANVAGIFQMSKLHLLIMVIMTTSQSCSEGHDSWNLLPAKEAAQELLSLSFLEALMQEKNHPLLLGKQPFTHTNPNPQNAYLYFNHHGIYWFPLQLCSAVFICSRALLCHILNLPSSSGGSLEKCFWFPLRVWGQ